MKAQPVWLRRSRRPVVTAGLAATLSTAALVVPGQVHADNKRFNASVVSNVYTLHRQAGCTDDLTVSPQLRLAAQWHTDNVLNDPSLADDVGSNGSTPQDRARAAGYPGRVAETVAINPALAMSGIELINQWYYNPNYLAIMRDCAYTQIGVWSDNKLDRTVVVAVYGSKGA